MNEEIKNNEHKCKYCEAMTTQDDEQCYANPNNKMNEEIKKEAEDLVEKFARIMPNENWRDRAIQCALIACDLMLNEPKMKFCGDGINSETYQRWGQIKQAIEQL